MMSRAAECCFWLHRYVERVDCTARMLDVNLSFVLDVEVLGGERWRPLLVVVGEAPRFDQIHGAAAAEQGEFVQEYLTWDQDNPASILASVYWARENARTIRETISLEMWRCLNGFWQWLSGSVARRFYQQDRTRFYEQVRETAQLFRGIAHDTMLHDDAFDFMRLGLLMERAGQTARVLDVKHHKLGPTRPRSDEAPEELAHWLAILRSCSATEPFLKRGRPPSGERIAEFLLLEPSLPRAVVHCVEHAWNLMRRIVPNAEASDSHASPRLLLGLLDRLKLRTIQQILAGGIHEELTHVVDSLAVVCDAIHRDFFDPALPGPEWANAQATGREPRE